MKAPTGSSPREKLRGRPIRMGHDRLGIPGRGAIVHSPELSHLCGAVLATPINLAPTHAAALPLKNRPVSRRLMLVHPVAEVGPGVFGGGGSAEDGQGAGDVAVDGFVGLLEHR